MTEDDTTRAIPESSKATVSTLEHRQFVDDGFATDALTGLGEEEWPAQTVKRGIHLRMPTAILLALLLAAGGLWGGSLLQKHEGGGSTTTGLAAARAGFSRAGATGVPSASSSSATSGTVTDIIGSTLYVTESNGSLVKVTLSSSATVTRNAKSSLSSLKPGDTVTVQGTTPKDGSMTASSVSATEAGVTSTAGGGGFGGAFAGRSGASS
jgi:Domain of unknown function (DUF5666)